MGSSWTKWREQFRGNTWLMGFNLVGVVFNLLLLGTIAVTAFIVEIGISTPFAWYPAVHWLVWAFAAAIHGMNVWNFPASTIQHIVAGLLGLLGGGLGGYSLGFYTGQFWWGCFFDQPSLNTTQLDVCLEANYIVMFGWMFALLVTIAGTTIAALSFGNAWIASSQEKKRRELTQ